MLSMVKRLPMVKWNAIAAICLIAVGCERHDGSIRPAVDERAIIHKPTDAGPTNTKTHDIVMVDRLDRRVCLAGVPRRVISLAPATTELLFAIGAGDLLVGATDHCNYPPAALQIARIGGGTMQGISHEIIVSLKPDLILGKWDTHQPLIESLDRMGIPMLAIGADSLAGLYEDAEMLGRVTGHEGEADRLIASMQSRVKALTSWVETVPKEKRRRVFYEVWDAPLMTAGPQSFIGELLELGGMVNVFDDTTVAYPRISDEVVLERNPEVILAPSTHQERVSLNNLLKRQGWDRVSAIKNRQVFLIDGDRVSRCGPRMLDALEEMIGHVYPGKLTADLSSEVTVH